MSSKGIKVIMVNHGGEFDENFDILLGVNDSLNHCFISPDFKPEAVQLQPV